MPESHIFATSSTIQEKGTLVLFVSYLPKASCLASRETAVNRNFLDMMPFTHGSVLGIVVFLVCVGVNDLLLMLIVQIDCCLFSDAFPSSFYENICNYYPKVMCQ